MYVLHKVIDMAEKVNNNISKFSFYDKIQFSLYFFAFTRIIILNDLKIQPNMPVWLEKLKIDKENAQFLKRKNLWLLLWLVNVKRNSKCDIVCSEVNFDQLQEENYFSLITVMVSKTLATIKCLGIDYLPTINRNCLKFSDYVFMCWLG